MEGDDLLIFRLILIKFGGWRVSGSNFKMEKAFETIFTSLAWMSLMSFVGLGLCGLPIHLGPFCHWFPASKYYYGHIQICSYFYLFNCKKIVI